MNKLQASIVAILSAGKAGARKRGLSVGNEQTPSTGFRHPSSNHCHNCIVIGLRNCQLTCVRAYVRARVCVCVCVGGGAALRIVSTDNILHFINTLIIINVAPQGEIKLTRCLR